MRSLEGLLPGHDGKDVSCAGFLKDGPWLRKLPGLGWEKDGVWSTETQVHTRRV